MDTGGMIVESPVVFVTNFSGHDYTDAERFGPIVYVTKGYVSFGSLDRVKFAICKALDESKPDDYLLLSGIPVICVLSVAYWMWKHERCNLLVHDKKRDGTYRELKLSAKNFSAINKVLNHVT